MKLEELQKQLSKFSYTEKAELTKKEIEVLKEMFSVEGSFKALLRHLSILESDKGSQMIYDIEHIPSDGQYTDREISDIVRFKKLTFQFVRGRIEALRNTFAVSSAKELKEAEDKKKEEQEKIDKKREELEIEKKGISKYM